MTTSPAYLLRKLRALSRREWRELVRAQWELLVAQATMRSRPVGGLATAVTEQPVVDGDRIEEARALARAVLRAARFGVFRPQCLARSMALSRMLESRGIRGGIVRVGVRRANGEFLAHAWVELAGETLGDIEEHVESFVPLTNLEVRPPS